MNQNTEINDLHKQIEIMKLLHSHFDLKDGSYIQYSTNELKQLVEKKIIPKELGEWYINYIDDRNRKFKEWKKFIDDNPNIPEEDRISFYLEWQKNQCSLSNKNPNSTEQDETHTLPEQFFKTIRSDEFGMSRLMADPINNFHKMIESFKEPEHIIDNLYITQAECENSYKDIIRLEYRLRASNQEDAIKQSQEFRQRLMGRQKKVYEACWALVNEKRSRIVTCDLTELMMIAYPDRENKTFSTALRIEFFQDLLDLSQTQITITKKAKSSSRKKPKIDKFALPFITIHKTSNYNLASRKKSERYPNNLSFSVLNNPIYAEEAMYNVGAGIKKRTLELRPEHLALAEYIQLRKNQIMNSKFITFTDRENLLKIANLDGIKHSGMANKKLISKFEHLKEKEIIIDYPKRVEFPFHVKIRI